MAAAELSAQWKCLRRQLPHSSALSSEKQVHLMSTVPVYEIEILFKSILSGLLGLLTAVCRDKSAPQAVPHGYSRSMRSSDRKEREENAHLAEILLRCSVVAAHGTGRVFHDNSCETHRPSTTC